MESELRREIHALAGLLDKLRATDVSLRVFGASHHRYVLGERMSEAELKSFEEGYGICLPGDYRLFLAEVGNGGAGPFYGLIPLLSASEWMDPGAIFPWMKAVFVDEQAAVVMKLAPCDMEEIRPAASEIACPVPGSLCMAHEGCGYFRFLVVNGSAYGTIWSDWRAADCGLVPAGLTFSAWYRRWLEECLSLFAGEHVVD